MSALNKLLIAASLGLALSACKKEEPVEVAPAAIAIEPAPAAVAPAPAPIAASVSIAAVNLGTTVGADQKVTAAATSFSNDDVIYAAIDTKNTGKDLALAIKWTLNGGTVHEESTMISPEGDLTTNFKFGNSGTRQAGKYKAEISLNGVLAKSVDFEIK